MDETNGMYEDDLFDEGEIGFYERGTGKWIFLGVAVVAYALEGGETIVRKMNDFWGSEILPSKLHNYHLPLMRPRERRE